MGPALTTKLELAEPDLVEPESAESEGTEPKTELTLPATELTLPATELIKSESPKPNLSVGDFWLSVGDFWLSLTASLVDSMAAGPSVLDSKTLPTTFLIGLSSSLGMGMPACEAISISRKSITKFNFINQKQIYLQSYPQAWKSADDMKK